MAASDDNALDTVDPNKLAVRTRRGITWNLLGAFATNATRLISLAVLGRALSSRDFGIVAAAVSVNTVVYSIRDIGLGPALIQRKQLDDAHISTAFSVSTYTGIALAGLLCVSASWIAAMFDIRDSTQIIRALALLFILRNFAATSRMLCRRALNFRLATLIDTSSFMVGSLVSIVGVVTFGGPWALVLGYWVEEIVATASYLIFRPIRMTFAVDRKRLRDLLDFGAGQTVTSITNVGATYGDNIVVGHVLGATSLGFYSRAFDLVRFPAMVFEAIVGNVLFSSFSRLQDNREQIATNFRRVMFVNALVLLPVTAALIVIAPEVIRVLLGGGWDEAVLPFRILAATIVVRTNQKLGALVAQSTGAVNAVAGVFTLYMVLVVGGAAVAVRWGIPGVATTTASSVAVLCIVCCALGLRESGLSTTDAFIAHAPGAAIGGCVGVVLYFAASAMRATSVPASYVVAALAPAAGVCALVGITIGMKIGQGDFVWLRGLLAELRAKRSIGRAQNAASERPPP